MPTSMPMKCLCFYQLLTFYFFWLTVFGPYQANLVLIAYGSNKGSGEPVHPCKLARTFAARSYKQWVKRNLQTESQTPGASDWLGMHSSNLSWRNARRHKFAWRGSFYFLSLIKIFLTLLFLVCCGIDGWMDWIGLHLDKTRHVK